MIIQGKKSCAPAVDKVLAIFDYLSEPHEPCNTVSLIKKLGIAQATGFRIINRLIDNSYLSKDPQTGILSLGYGAIKLGNAAAEQSEKRQQIAGLLHEIVEKCGESAELSWLENFEIYVLNVVESDQPVRLKRQAGTRIIGLTNPITLAMLAFLPEEKVETVAELDRQAARTREEMGLCMPGIAYRNELKKNILANVKSNGFAADYGLQTKDITRIAVPVLDRQGFAVGVLSVAGPTYRLNKADEQRTVTTLKRASKKAAEVCSL